MKVLVAFASSEGHTRKVAKHVADFIAARGDSVQLYDVQSLEPTNAVGSFNAILLAASVHEGKHQHSMAEFAIAHREQLARVPAAFLSVSLSAASDDGLAEAQSYVDHFFADTNWQPKKSLLVAGALRLGDYDYFQRQVMAHILRKRGLPTSDDGNHEFTDWAALDAFVLAFLKSRDAAAA